MIGMNFVSFFSLLVISAICASIVRSILRPGVLHTGTAYLCEWIMGWIGAWIGSPVVGHWGWTVPGSDVYLISAAIGSIAATFTLVALFKSVESFLTPLSQRETTAPSGARIRVV